MKKIILLAMIIGSLTGCASVPPLNFSTPNVGVSQKKIDAEIRKINGIKSASNSLKFGIDEIKLKVNSYGEQLGLTESFIGTYLSNLYLLKKKAVSFDEKEMLDIKIESINKDWNDLSFT